MEQPFLILAQDTTREMIEKESIVYVTVLDKYIQLKLTDSRTRRVRTSLRQFEKHLSPDIFLRIHKRYIVCIRHIRFVDMDVTMKNGDQLPISREFKDAFLSHFCIF
ncbi:LytTR family transcriptional regulator [Chitinophaga filiformis]|uniref:LytR/AlgR family response regulator transcription factor n=1 Tax=Chitinophaga filiformis TaxID=104663 RepID=UPI001F3EF31D|nr:LytTR family DNA-binding domain-containing protein [Chitinophaga filiformis]MCF6403121.1 LytTR family transcriptional regulator [Chitinophaga filiformis]